MGTHAGAMTGSRDVVRAGASEGIGESGVVEPSVTEHSVRGPIQMVVAWPMLLRILVQVAWLVLLEILTQLAWCVTWVMSLQM